jgi:dihydrolipoamide dehydrogenase
MVVGDVTTGTEVLVIGGGPGGYVAGIRAGQLGHDVTLVEATEVGGTCLNEGCIPSKALISATDIAHRAGAAERLGVHADPAVDLAAMVGWKDRLVGRLTSGVESLLERAGVTVVEGRAEFNSGEEVRVVHDGEGQGSETVSFEHAVVATGSRPVELPFMPFDGDRVLSSKGALALETVPESLAVVGAGYIGMELATVYAKLGAEVTVLEQLEDALPGYADDLTAVVRERAEEVGVDFRFGEGVEGYERLDGGVELETEGEPVAAERCLVAVGRAPVTDTVGLEAAGVETDDDGFVVTDEQGRTSRETVFAVGDVAGEPMLAHAAFREGEVAAEAIDGQPAALDNRAIPAAVFTDPEIATVGMTEAEARGEGFEPAVGEMPLRASGRALTLNEREGFVRVVADADHGFLLGAEVVGPEASELVAEVTLAIEMGATLEDLAATVHVHPTLSEAVHEAAMGALDRSIHY